MIVSPAGLRNLGPSLLEVSPRPSDRKLVLKDWQGKNDEISIRYGAEWQNPDGGEITYKRTGDNGYRATTGGKAVYAGGGGKLSLKLSFKDVDRKAHVAKFYATLF